jgi:hypothetical protein
MINGKMKNRTGKNKLNTGERTFADDKICKKSGD